MNIVVEIDTGVNHNFAKNEHRKVFLPVTPEQYSHDEDGNLLSDGRWVYEWDGENRLAAMETGLDAAAAGAPQVRLEFVYDYLSRRVAKRVYVPDQGGEEEGVQDGGVAGQTDLSGLDEAEGDGEDPPINWTLEATYKYVWDGWLLVAEVDGQNNAVRSYGWGLDLSGTMQGAGGIGGLLFVTQHVGSNQGTYHAFHDGRGDVTSLRDDAGNVAAAYEYGPFGELLTRSGDYAAANPFRFSSKFTDPETGLVYFGYRYYNPGTGRWLSRDPIEEMADSGVLYVYIRNTTIGTIDPLGLSSLELFPDPGTMGTPSRTVRRQLGACITSCQPPPTATPNWRDRRAIRACIEDCHDRILATDILLCTRSIAKDGDCKERCARGIFNCISQHSFLSHRGDDRCLMGEEEKGDLPSTENANYDAFGRPITGTGSMPVQCGSCRRSTSESAVLRHGIGAGSHVLDVTEAEIWDCIKNAALPVDYNWFFFNCNDWVRFAQYGCGLSCQ